MGHNTFLIVSFRVCFLFCLVVLFVFFIFFILNSILCKYSCLFFIFGQFVFIIIFFSIYSIKVNLGFGSHQSLKLIPLGIVSCDYIFYRKYSCLFFIFVQFVFIMIFCSIYSIKVNLGFGSNR